ncbi:MAG: 4'-phosphopantetheinyl transferase family protein [Cyanobacteriota bacterium]
MANPGAPIPPPPPEPLHPLAWRLEDSPPPPPEAAADPLLLRLDRRDPLVAAVPEALLATLSAAERQRHAAYRQRADQERFLVGRCALRRLLGHWLGQRPAAVALDVDLRGKPRCAGGPGFNLSHSGDLILLAFHGNREVGVDVERERPDLDWRPIAERVFPLALTASLEGLPPEARSAAFLRAWCRLEARLKACGEGLSGLERLRQSACPEHPVAGMEREPEILWDVAVPPGYAAAVALENRLRAPAGAEEGDDHPSPRR